MKRIGLIGGWATKSAYVFDRYVKWLGEHRAGEVEVVVIDWWELIKCANDNETYNDKFSEFDVVVGWSLGGMLAIKTIYSKKYILVASFAYFYDLDNGLNQKNYTATKLMLNQLEKNKVATVTAFLQLVFDYVKNSDIDNYVNNAIDMDNAVLSSGLSELLRSGESHRINSIKNSILNKEAYVANIVGLLDNVVPVELSFKLNELFADHEFIQLDGAKHNIIATGFDNIIKIIDKNL